MEITTYSQCACANCGHIIDYHASSAGEIVECPKCGEKSRLPEVEKLGIIEEMGPPIPSSKICAVCGNEMRFFAQTCPFCDQTRKRKIQVAVLLSATVVVVVLVVLALVRPFKKSESSILADTIAGTNANSSPSAPHILIEQPRPRMPKSTNDLQPGRFTLEKSRGSDLAIAVGDIKNDSDNVHTGLKATLDLLDKNGVKIGTAIDYFTELGPHQNWHFLVTVPETNASSVRFASITEDH